ncbi:DUF262 domain-containing protein [Yersinia sp. Marseille-Q3913]|uniref:GmrSD restriction endonuclease domain-containing protein n=1 Tax=Yersinia sp. Marseille-Q3913 TaxID=2830769 RepID=UPI001BAEC8A3|nr:DUF262 domain-containing protein [Yersinia sp. Marseille-Q3913]MBS0055545.1 DUF262 domain-containing protein [Yersinia sp. Marseille-Q3913]
MSSITPRGMNITEAYRDYRNGKFLVNRSYQRKLVWTTKEKQKLIDSLLLGYPIPLILLALTKNGEYEIIDGMQRLNAIFDFIENKYSLTSDSYFNVEEFPTAKQTMLDGYFDVVDSHDFLTRQQCADIIEYQLAVTIFPIENESDVTDVFGRINSGGKQLSFQEKRQAGVITPLSSSVRKLSSELRGDSSSDVLKLSEMPSISIDGYMDRQGYGVNASDTFWVKQGVLNTKELRDSVDEQIISDIVVSIIEGKPFASSKEKFDELYDSTSELSGNVCAKIISYPEDKLLAEVTTTISTIITTFNKVTKIDNHPFKNVIYGGKASNSARSSFYTVFMAYYDLVIKESKAPVEYDKIITALTSLNDKLKTDKKHVTSEDRISNISMTKGLIQNFFVPSTPSLLTHGPGLYIDFENSLRRSKIETVRYEFKQGILNLDAKKSVNKKLLEKINEIICSMANIGPDVGEGYIFIGVSDNQSDSERIRKMYDLESVQIGDKDIFGVDREAKQLNIGISDYVAKIVNSIRNSELSSHLKQSVLNNIDTIDYKGHSVVRVLVPKQKEMSFIGDNTYIRVDSNTVTANPKQAAQIMKLFS